MFFPTIENKFSIIFFVISINISILVGSVSLKFENLTVNCNS